MQAIARAIWLIQPIAIRFLCDETPIQNYIAIATGIDKTKLAVDW